MTQRRVQEGRRIVADELLQPRFAGLRIHLPCQSDQAGLCLGILRIELQHAVVLLGRRVGPPLLPRRRGEAQQCVDVARIGDERGLVVRLRLREVLSLQGFPALGGPGGGVVAGGGRADLHTFLERALGSARTVCLVGHRRCGADPARARNGSDRRWRIVDRRCDRGRRRSNRCGGHRRRGSRDRTGCGLRQWRQRRRHGSLLRTRGRRLGGDLEIRDGGRRLRGRGFRDGRIARRGRHGARRWHGLGELVLRGRAREEPGMVDREVDVDEVAREENQRPGSEDGDRMLARPFHRVGCAARGLRCGAGGVAIVSEVEGPTRRPRRFDVARFEFERAGRGRRGGAGGPGRAARQRFAAFRCALERLQQQAHRAGGISKGAVSCSGRGSWVRRNFSSSESSDGLRITVGRRKITSSVLRATSLR